MLPALLHGTLRQSRTPMICTCSGWARRRRRPRAHAPRRRTCWVGRCHAPAAPLLSSWRGGWRRRRAPPLHPPRRQRRTPPPPRPPLTDTCSCNGWARPPRVSARPTHGPVPPLTAAQAARRRCRWRRGLHLAPQRCAEPFNTPTRRPPLYHCARPLGRRRRPPPSAMTARRVWAAEGRRLCLPSPWPSSAPHRQGKPRAAGGASWPQWPRQQARHPQVQPHLPRRRQRQASGSQPALRRPTPPTRKARICGTPSASSRQRWSS